MMEITEHKRVVIHFDIDCFYAQVEMIRNPELRHKPLGIQQKYLLVTCNYEARKRGVTKLMSIVEAKKKCPDLVIVNGEDLTHYRNMSYQISDFLQKYTPLVERLGFDENYVDVTEMVEDRKKNKKFEHRYSGHVFEQDSEKDAKDCPICSCGCLLRTQIGSQIASDIREGLKHELDITCCAGIAYNKLLAKLVGSINKPNQQTSVLPHLGCQLVSSLPGVRSIPGVGHMSEKRLKAKGIISVWDLQQAPLSVLEEEFGKATAKSFKQLCFGADDSPIVPLSLPQTLSDEDSFKCCNSSEDAKIRIYQLAVSLLQRLKEDQRIPHTLRLTVRRNNYARFSRQCPIPLKAFARFHEEGGLEIIMSHLMPLLMNLFEKLVDISQPFHLTLINICFAKLIKPNSNQNKIESFFSQNHSKGQKNPQALTGLQTNIPITDVEMALDVNENITITDRSADSNKSCYSQNKIAHSTKQNDKDIEDESSSFKNSSDKSPPSSLTYGISSQLVDIGENEFILSNPATSCEPSYKVIQNHSSQTLQRLLPKHIDVDDIFQLPNDIQIEILSGFGINMRLLSNGEILYTNANRVSTRSKQHCKSPSSEKREGFEEKSSTCCRQPLFSPKKRKRKNQDTEDTKLDEANCNKSMNNRLDNDCQVDCFNCESTKNISVQEGPDTDIETTATTTTTTSSKDFSERLEPNQDTNLTLSEKGSYTVNDAQILEEIIFEENTSAPCKTKPPTFSSDYIKIHKSTNFNTSVNQQIKSCATQGPSSSMELNTTSSKSTPESKKRICPEGIDPDVFFSLPSNIQGEILAHNEMGTGNLFLDNKNQKQPKLYDSVSVRNRTDSNTNTKGKKMQGDILKYFKRT